MIGKIYPEPVIRINSIDLAQNAVISSLAEMLSFNNPSDWLSLPELAFVAAGRASPLRGACRRQDALSQDEERGLRDILKEFGGGIDLTLFSAVPAGSGLGTSSILGSAVITCLSRMLGVEGDIMECRLREVLFNRTLYMEQLMTTGGGWQDQIGSAVGGVKHITTEPGLFQVPRISWTDLKVKSNVDLSERFLLYYTGYRRMAKNILRSIVGRYLDRDPVTLETIHQLREKSFEMKEELDPGISNERIEAILDKILDYILGVRLLGAGSGGFLFIVTKNGV